MQYTCTIHNNNISFLLTYIIFPERRTPPDDIITLLSKIETDVFGQQRV